MAAPISDRPEAAHRGAVATASTRVPSRPQACPEEWPMVREDVEFQSEGTTVRGWLYRPDDADGDVPAVVLAGGWCYVRELVMPYYAESFAAAGIAALVFDYRNLGVSD